MAGNLKNLPATLAGDLKIEIYCSCMTAKGVGDDAKTSKQIDSVFKSLMDVFFFLLIKQISSALSSLPHLSYYRKKPYN